MAERIARSGALNVRLTPGKRGRYELTFNSISGWDPSRDDPIQSAIQSDEVPEKPWIAVFISSLSSPGRKRGGEKLEYMSVPLLLITHHALSRTAQRFGLRTDVDLIVAALMIWGGVEKFHEKIGYKAMRDAPPEGWRVPFGPDGEATVVLKLPDPTVDVAFIAVTVF
jgi:hypothetical protein